VIVAIIIGLVSGVVPYFAVAVLKRKLGYDGALDVFGIYGVGEILGAVLTSVFAAPSINEAGKGLIYGNPGQVLRCHSHPCDPYGGKSPHRSEGKP